MTGKFIVIEGSDGAGKATQVKLLEKFLQNKGITHKTISIPRYKDNIYGSFIEKYLRGEFGNPLKIDAYFTALPYAMDRLLAKPLIENWLKKYSLVIADRYAYSNMAFGAAKLPPAKRSAYLKWVNKLEFQENQIPREDLVIYLYVPVEFSQKLMSDRNKDGHEKSVSYQKDVEKEYLKLAKGNKWVKIDCVLKGELLSREQIHRQVITILQNKKIV
jgi:dTMP kinase